MGMTAGPYNQRDRDFLRIWWIIWAAILLGLVVIYFALGRRPLPPGSADDKTLTGLIGLVPLFVSIVIRWLVLPRYRDLRRAFPMFVIGLALAEGCGLLGIFLGGPYRDDVFLLGVLGLVQFTPWFAHRLLDPAPAGYIPNN